jgi:hypothetical protein
MKEISTAPQFCLKQRYLFTCSLAPEKLPWTEWVMPVALWSVKLYKYMLTAKLSGRTNTWTGSKLPI